MVTSIAIGVGLLVALIALAFFGRRKTSRRTSTGATREATMGDVPPRQLPGVSINALFNSHASVLHATALNAASADATTHVHNTEGRGSNRNGNERSSHLFAGKASQRVRSNHAATVSALANVVDVAQLGMERADAHSSTTATTQPVLRQSDNDVESGTHSHGHVGMTMEYVQEAPTRPADRHTKSTVDYVQETSVQNEMQSEFVSFGPRSLEVHITDRTSVEARLRAVRAEGGFILRATSDADVAACKFALSYYSLGAVVHHRLAKRPDGFFALDHRKQGRFSSLEEVLGAATHAAKKKRGFSEMTAVRPGEGVRSVDVTREASTAWSSSRAAEVDMDGYVAGDSHESTSMPTYAVPAAVTQHQEYSSAAPRTNGDDDYVCVDGNEASRSQHQGFEYMDADCLSSGSAEQGADYISLDGVGGRYGRGIQRASRKSSLASLTGFGDGYNMGAVGCVGDL